MFVIDGMIGWFAQVKVKGMRLSMQSLMLWVIIMNLAWSWHVTCMEWLVMKVAWVWYERW